MAMNGAMPVPVETKRWVRSSSGSSMKRPLGPIMRIWWPTGRRQSRRREAKDGHQAHVELEALLTGGLRRRGHRVRALIELVIGVDADGHVLAGLEVGHRPVGADPEAGQRVVVVFALHQRGVVLLRRRLDDARVVSGRWSVMTLSVRGCARTGVCARASLRARGGDGPEDDLGQAGSPRRTGPDGRGRCGRPRATTNSPGSCHGWSTSARSVPRREAVHCRPWPCRPAARGSPA